MDFTSVYLTPKIGHDASNTTVQDCIVVLEYMEAGQRRRVNFDFLCDCAETNKNDYHFVLHVWLKLFMEFQIRERFDILLVWSDGGPHHFKTRYCQWMWHWLSVNRFSNKPIIHNFFASYHGHSLADSHAAAIKRVLRSQYTTSQIQRFSPNTSALYWGPANAPEFASLLSHACPNTQLYIFPRIDRNPLLKPNCSAVDEIKKKHCFVYAGGNCAASVDSSLAPKQPFSFVLKQ
jgi:hypothetical protein